MTANAAADGMATPQSPEGTAALWHGIQTPGRLSGLSELIARGAHLKLIEPESRASNVYDVLKLTTLSDGFESLIYRDRATGLITRSREVRAFHVDNDPTRQHIESIAADFHRVGGILRPFRTTNIDLDTGSILATTAVTAMRTPTRLDDDLFAMPTQS